jgi:prophage regulatory protein
MNAFPENGFLRLTQIIGSKKKGEPPIIPVSKATWWAGVKSGRYPKPTRALGERITAWHVDDIRALIKAADNSEVRQ